MIAEIIVNSTANELNRVFDYEIPEEYQGGKNIDIGYRVLVSFAFFLIASETAFIYSSKPMGSSSLV